jgi:hypothetical protein
LALLVPDTKSPLIKETFGVLVRLPLETTTSQGMAQATRMFRHSKTYKDDHNGYQAWNLPGINSWRESAASRGRFDYLSDGSPGAGRRGAEDWNGDHHLWLSDHPDDR